MKTKSLLAILMSSLLCISSAYGESREYRLTIAQQQVNVSDKMAEGMTINGAIPGPTLQFREGDTARIHVTNDMQVATSIHWHGLLVPPTMDGVPLITQVPILPGTTFIYNFPIRQTGTYWYHSHSGLQEQRGLYGSIVIEDNEHSTDRDHVVLLSDWTTDSPDAVLRTLKRGSEWFSLQKGSSQSILGATKAGRLGDYFMRELQRMPPMDIADVAYDYFLSNGKPETTLESNGGEVVRLRVINGSATTYFHLNFAGGPMKIISADGQLVQPVDKDLFLIGVAETYDVLVTVPDRGSYELRATAHDGSGYTSTWLGKGKKHPTRAIPLPNLYEPMAHGMMGSLLSLTPAGSIGMPDRMVKKGVYDKPGMSHSEHGMADGSMTKMSGHQMENTMDMKQTDMAHSGNEKTPQKKQRSDMSHTMTGSVQKKQNPMSPMKKDKDVGHKWPKEIQSTPMSAHTMTKPTVKSDSAMEPMTHQSMDMKKTMVGGQDVKTFPTARSYGGEFGFLATDIGSRPYRASEGGDERPGTPYQLLKSREPSRLPADAPVREVRLTLDGDMERYTWFLNNKPLAESDSILIKEGEVVRFIMINRTMMHHPMHLHGHFFRVLNGQGDYSPLKHTVDVAPMTTTVIEFYGNELGDWFFHCHLLYHMKTGMARLVHYQDFNAESDVTAVRGQLYQDPWYFYGQADILSNMTEGSLTLVNSRFSVEAGWEAGWQEVDETDWEGMITLDYHVNRFASFVTGIDILGEESSSEETRGVLGLRYLLPLNVESTLWLDTDGGGRVMFEKEFELTPRVGLHGEVEYDTHSQWEGKIGLSYLLTKEISLETNYHSEFGIGLGLQLRF